MVSKMHRSSKQCPSASTRVSGLLFTYAYRLRLCGSSSCAYGTGFSFALQSGAKRIAVADFFLVAASGGLHPLRAQPVGEVEVIARFRRSGRPLIGGQHL